MADNQESNYGPYKDEALQYADLIGNVLNPPAAGPTGPTQPAPTPAAAPAVSPAQPPAPSPAGVTRSGNPSTQQSKSWADYVRGSLDTATAAQGQGQQAMSAIEGQPTVTSQNAPLMRRRADVAQPLDPNAQQYKPGIGTRIVRGVGAYMKGGPLALVNPEAAGATAYGAPNRRFGQDASRQQQTLGSIDAEMKGNEENAKADTERLGKIGSEQRANATTALDIGKTATAQQTAEDKSDQNAALDKLRQERDEAKANKLPTTFESAVVAASMEQDPRKKAALNSAVQQMRDMEIKKFTYAMRATGGADPNDKRQPMIDQATAEIQKLNDFEFDPSMNDGKGGFYDPSAPNKVYTPERFTDEKNKIATKLDAQLAKAKLRPLGVRFNVKGTTPGVGPDGSLLPPGQTQAPPAAPAQTAPQPAQQPKQGQFAVQDGGGKHLTDATLAKQYLAKAGGDKEKARQLAKQDRWQF